MVGNDRLKIFLHDYAGHPFQIELSRYLARLGHEVIHVYSGANPSNPKGEVSRRDDDLENLIIKAIPLSEPINKGSLIKRWRLERAYGKHLGEQIKKSMPDVVILSNTPLDASARAIRVCKAKKIPVIYWLQDLIGEATSRILGKRFGLLGYSIGAYYKRLESKILRSSAHIVGITRDFRDMVISLGISESSYTTIPNWAPLNEISPRPKRNGWSLNKGLSDRFVFLYSGTLGFKHNPGVLLSLAREFSDVKDVVVVVNSQGEAADWLKRQAQLDNIDTLQVNPYQPYGVLSEVLGTADVLVSILEQDAGIFSVPSKVLSYHCAARPLLLAVPCNNLAAQIVSKEMTGLVVEPDDTVGFIRSARALYNDALLRREMATRARSYAESNFDIVRISEKFQNLICHVVQTR